MNKINYILDLTGIRMPAGVKAEAEKRIKNANELYEKKDGKKKAAVVLALVCAFVLIVASVVVITKTVNSNRPIIPETTETETETDITETDAPDNAEPEEDYYVFDSLYKNYYRYEIFKTAINLIKPYENDLLITAADLSSLYHYFGAAVPSAEELCETFFAFYTEGHVIQYQNLPKSSMPELDYIRSELQDESKPDLYRDVYGTSVQRSEEIILMTSKNGTFEYLLTLPVYTADTYIYDRNSSSRKIGRISGGKYYISHQYMLTAEANVYKIRFESGLPVIYAKYTIQKGSLILPEDDGTFFFGIGLKSEKSDNGNEKIISGKFKIAGNIFEFKNEENSMTDPVFTSVEGTRTSAYLCDYPYCFPSYDESGLCGRKTVCDIINKYGLQWFFPMYVTSYDNGTMQITGNGIMTGERIYGTENELSSTICRLYGAAYENNIYTTYNGSIIPSFLSSALPEDNPEHSVGLCYMPETCDTPYFDKSYFNSRRTLMSITVSEEGQIVDFQLTNPDFAKLYADEPLDAERFKPALLTDFLYIKDKNDKYFPTRAFDIKYLPLLSEHIMDTPTLFSSLGLSIPEYRQLYCDYTQFTLGHRNISVIGAEGMLLSGVFTETSKLSDTSSAEIDTPDNKCINAYEEINGYIIDMKGCVCGIANDFGVYIFTTAEPCFNIMINAKDGFVMYSSYSSDISYKVSDNTFLDYEMLPPDQDTDVRADTLLYLLYSIGEYAPAIDLWNVTFDKQTAMYTMRVNIMKLSNEEEVFGIRNKNKRIYSFYKDVSMIKENGRVYWICTDDYYAHGFYQLKIECNGYNVEIRVAVET